MITKNKIQATIIIVTTLVLFWVLPWAVKLASNEASSFPFTYYSTIKEKFIQTQFHNDKIKYIDTEGNEYDRNEYDSIVPMLNYRQLIQDGTLPDSINGVETSPRTLRANSFFIRYRPTAYNTKGINLYPMFESMSGRVSLESPKDLFTIDKTIRFYDAETNNLMKDKSNKFQTAMEKKGFEFPVQWISGNASARKPYDEGWFMLDKIGQLFQVKMVNGKPFVKNTNANKDIEIKWMQTIETSNRRMYGFVFDNNQNVYFLSDVTYELVKIPISKIDIEKDQMLIMGNLFYWNIALTKDNTCEYFAIDNNTMKLKDSHISYSEKTPWEKIQKWVFLFYIELESSNTTFIYPHFLGWSLSAIILNLLCAISIFILAKKDKTKRKVIKVVFVLITGICGLIALQLFKRNNQETKDIIQLT